MPDLADELALPERVVLHGGGHEGITNLPPGLFLGHGTYEGLRYADGHIEVLGVALPVGNVTNEAPNVSATLASVPDALTMTTSTPPELLATDEAAEPPLADAPVATPEAAEVALPDAVPSSTADVAAATGEPLGASGDASESQESAPAAAGDEPAA